MSKKKKTPRPKGPPQLSPAQVEQIKREFEEAQAKGDPIAALAEQLAQMENVITVQGESLGTLIEDQNVPLDVGRYLPRPADFLISPDGAVRNIKATTEPELMMGDIEVHPERLAREWVIVNNLICAKCQDKTEKPGWNVEAPDTEHGLLVVQCLKCHHYLWVVRGAPKDETDEPM